MTSHHEIWHHITSPRVNGYPDEATLKEADSIANNDVAFEVNTEPLNIGKFVLQQRFDLKFVSWVLTLQIFIIRRNFMTSILYYVGDERNAASWLQYLHFRGKNNSR